MKTTIKLPNGTTFELDGTPEEIAKVVEGFKMAPIVLDPPAVPVPLQPYVNPPGLGIWPPMFVPNIFTPCPVRLIPIPETVSPWSPPYTFTCHNNTNELVVAQG